MRAASILIVDDQVISRTILANLLGADYRFHFAGSGEEGLEMARATVPDLVMLDAMMPGMDGFEVLRQLREDPLLAEIPILMMTALEDWESKVRGLRGGADDFLSKPFNGEELRARVATITRLNRFRLLLNQSSRFEQVIEHADEGFLLLDLQGGVNYANSRARGLLTLPEGPCSFVQEARKHFRCVPPEAWLEWPSEATEILYLVREDSWVQVWTHADAQAGEYIVRLRDVTESLGHQMSAWMLQASVSQKLSAPMAKVTRVSEQLDDSASPKLRQAAAMADAGVAELREAILGILGHVTYISGVGPAVCAVPALVAEMGFSAVVVGVLSERVLALSVGALQQALTALFDNSLRFHPQGTPSIVVTLREWGTRLSLVVEDDGVSLTPIQLQRALLPYYQGEKSHTGQMAGMGLGLATVAGMLWEVGGDCLISNREKGPGVRVELVIPT